MIIEENIDLKLLDCFFQFFFSCKTYTKIKMHKKINNKCFHKFQEWFSVIWKIIKSNYENPKI